MIRLASRYRPARCNGRLLHIRQFSDKAVGGKTPAPSAVMLMQRLQEAATAGRSRETSALVKQLRPHLRLEALTRKSSKQSDGTSTTSDVLAGISHHDLTNLLNTLLAQCTSKEAVLALFNDLTRDGVRPNVHTYTTVMRVLLKPPTKWDDIKTILSIRQRMVDAEMKDNADTIGVLLALAALQTPIRHEKYEELWRLIKDQDIEIHPEDYVYFFDMPPTAKYEPFIQQVVEAMQARPDVSQERIYRYLAKWNDLREKYEDADFEFGVEPTEDTNANPSSVQKSDNVPIL